MTRPGRPYRSASRTIPTSTARRVRSSSQSISNSAKARLPVRCGRMVCSGSRALGDRARRGPLLSQARLEPGIRAPQSPGLFPRLTSLSHEVLGEPRPDHRHGARAEVCIELTVDMQRYSQRECVRHDVQI